MDTRLKEAGAKAASGAASASSPSTFLTAWSAAVRRPGAGAGACCGRDGAGATKCCHSAADGEKGLRARHTGRERAACMRGALVGGGQAVARPLGAASMEALRGCLCLCLCLECRYLLCTMYELSTTCTQDRNRQAGRCRTLLHFHWTALHATGRCRWTLPLPSHLEG